jgi:3-hydroxyisobutyrate dehydrogenase-like beta-hydroxyacid dehydrogenase
MDAGLIGLGLMGLPMAECVLRAGHRLTVWNRTAAKADALVAAGARWAGSPREVAAASDVVVTVVADPAAVEAVAFGESGVLAGMRAGATLVDSSTVSPALARRLAAACRERGADFLDAPVTGGTWGAEKGELVFMVGGPPEALERARPVLSAMGKRFFALGDHGAGQTVKLAMNLLLALEVGALAEAMALVGRAGLRPESLVEVMQSSMARAPVLDLKARSILQGSFPASFPLRLMHKDLGLAMDLARDLGLTLPAGQAALRTYGAARDAGAGDDDYAAVAKVFSK